MLKNCSSLKWGQMVMPLIVVVSLLATVSVKADVVDVITDDDERKTITLLGNQGKADVQFSADSIGGSDFTFSRTYKLDADDAVFTSFVFDPTRVHLNLQSIVNNVSLGANEFPAIDLAGLYEGTMRWQGTVRFDADWAVPPVVTNGQYDGSHNIAGIDYDPDFIEAGDPGVVGSNYHEANFEDLEGYNFGRSALAGINEITFEFSLFDIDFFSSIEDSLGEGMFAGWAGIIDGAFLITWEAEGNTPLVPEPASVLIFGLGLVGAGVVASRKRRGKK